MAEVEYDYWTGHINEVVSSLNRSLSAFERHYKFVKVGITSRNPKVRFSEHVRSENWDRMVVKYKTTSKRYVNLIEDYFIFSHQNLKNFWYGNSHMTDNTKERYLYFLLKEKKINHKNK